MHRKERADVCDLRIHLALHVARRRIAAIPKDALVVHEAARVLPVEEFAHLVDIPAAARLVAA